MRVWTIIINLLYCSSYAVIADFIVCLVPILLVYYVLLYGHSEPCLGCLIVLMLVRVMVILLRLSQCQADSKTP